MTLLQPPFLNAIAHQINNMLFAVFQIIGIVDIHTQWKKKGICMNEARLNSMI